jgi:hypothetical protein
MAAGCGDGTADGTAGPSSNGVRSLAVASTRDLGAVGMPANVVGRDGGFSGLVGGKILWVFGDTFFNPPASDGEGFRSNTGALADPARPLEVSEPLDAAGAPYPLLPFTPQEKRYNDSTGKPDERIALWPGTVVPDGGGGGLLFYVALKVHPGTLNYELIGTGVARVAPGSTTATRDPGFLFRAPEPSFDKAMLVGSDLYLYGTSNDGSSDLPVVMARVPLAQLADRSAYRFWDGKAWSADVASVRPIMSWVPGEMTISYNAWLGGYLAVHSGPFSNDVLMRTAPRPEGPWSAPIVAVKGIAPPQGGNDYAGKEHPELASDGGRIVVVSYAHPTGGFLAGEVRVAEVTLK